MTLKDRIQDDMKAAMRAQDKARLSVIRLILAALKQREVDERITLEDAHIIAVLERMMKQRRESITQYQQAGRTDLVDQEAFELAVIQSYLPTALDESEVDILIDKAIAEIGAHTLKDMGKVVALLKPQLQGRADMATVSARIKARLDG